MKQVILIGYFKETIELCEKCGFTIVGYVDKTEMDNYPYLGDDERFIENSKSFKDIPLVITPDNPVTRGIIYEKYKELGFRFQTIIAPDAVVSKTATISEGCIISSLCNVSSDVFLGKCVRLNVRSNVMHDVRIEDYSVVAPNAVLLGCVNVGSKAYVGANSTILPHVCIGGQSTVGAGAVVTKDVSGDVVVAGVPARHLINDR